MSKLAGIESSKVSLARGEAVVIYDPRLVTPEQMALAINRGTSFHARVLAVDAAPDEAEEDCLFLNLFCD